MTSLFSPFLRGFSRRPLFAVSSIVLLTLGSGLAGTLATVIRDVMVRPVPYRDGERLHLVLQQFTGRTDREGAFNTFDFRAFQSARLPAFAGVGVLDYRPANLEHGETLARVSRTALTASVVEFTGIVPAVGRAVQPADEEPGAPPVALLSHKTWIARYDGDPSVVGRTIRLDGIPHTVIGVMPPRFALWGAEIWTAATLEREALATGPREHTIVALLARGFTTEQAQELVSRHFAAIADRIPAAAPEYTGRQAHLLAILPLVLRDLRPTLTILAVAIGLLLTLTTVNFGSLLFLRLAALRQDFAVRVALGAKPHNLIVEILLESGPLVVASGVLAMLVVRAGVPLMMAFTPSTFIPAEALVRVDAPILAATFAGTLVLGALAIGIPCWALLRSGGGADLAQAARVHRGSRRLAWIELAIVIVEVGLAFVVVLGTAEVGLTLGRIGHDSGFEVTSTATTRVVLPVPPNNRGALQASINEAEAALVALPAVNAASLARSRPLIEVTWRDASIPGQDPTAPGARFATHYRPVSAGYLAATGMRLHAGRFLAPTDGPNGPPVVVINETLARRLAPDGAPIGRRLTLHSTHDGGSPRTVSIVGVVNDTLQPRQRQRTVVEAEIYAPLLQDDAPETDFAVIVRGRPGTPVSFASIQAALKAATGPATTFYEPRDFESLLDERLGPQRLAAYILAVLGPVALLVATLGLYALLAFALAQRTREMGIRQALGATPVGLVALFVKRSTVLAMAGLVAGLLAYQFALSPLTQQLLGSAKLDPIAVTASVATLFVATLVAGLIPGIRAARIDPICTLRAD